MPEQGIMTLSEEQRFPCAFVSFKHWLSSDGHSFLVVKFPLSLRHDYVSQLHWFLLLGVTAAATTKIYTVSKNNSM